MAMSKEVWKQAFQDSVSAEFEDIPLKEEEIEYSFSEEFLRKMDRLVYCQKKWSWNMVNTLRKRVAIFAIVILALFTTACSIEEVREEIIRWCIDVYEEFNHLFFEGDTTKEITHAYELMVVPEGFMEVEREECETCRVIGYEKESGEYIEFLQYATDEQEFFMDNENGKEYVISIREMDVQIYEHETLVSGMWLENGDCMILTYFRCKDMEEFKSIIESIQ